MVQDLLNIEQFCHWKLIKIKRMFLGKLGPTFGIIKKCFDEWDFMEMIS
jgi:hypothetical protein